MCRGLPCEALRGSEAYVLLLYAQQYRANGSPQPSSQPCFSFGLPYVRWSCWRSQVGDGGLQDKHIALGSELETTQGLDSALRLLGNDFCSTLSLAK